MSMESLVYLPSNSNCKRYLGPYSRKLARFAMMRLIKATNTLTVVSVWTLSDTTMLERKKTIAAEKMDKTPKNLYSFLSRNPRFR